MDDSTPRPLEQIRHDIDAIDDQLVALLNERASLAQEVGRWKQKGQKPFFTPERERQIFQSLKERNLGPLRHTQLESIFREIVSAARAAEKVPSVAYWGPAGTFTHMAGLQTFGSSSELVPIESIEDVFYAVDQDKADYGVLPIENSIAGVVPQTLDMFPQTNVKICAETYVPIHHHLVSLAERLEDIKTVYAGPQPAGQCKRWLRSNLPSAKVIEVVPTAAAAAKALEDPTSAAIANKLGAETVGIPVLAEHIEDNPSNRTRFIVIGFNEPTKTGADKTSLMFSLRNRPGELYTALGAFVKHGVNLMMIESRPAQRAAFEYIFYADCVGHRTDVNLQDAIALLKGHALETVVLGSYPAAEGTVFGSVS